MGGSSYAGVASARPSGRHASQSPPKKFARLASPAGQNGVLPSDAAAVRRLRDSQGMTHNHSEALQSIRADIESGRLKEVNPLTFLYVHITACNHRHVWHPENEICTE